jgi:hypothetical protein
MTVPDLAKLLMFFGAGVFLLGGVFWLASNFGAGNPLQYLGKLPGDIRVERPGFSFYFPLTTCILVSLVLTGIFWLIGRFR